MEVTEGVSRMRFSIVAFVALPKSPTFTLELSVMERFEIAYPWPLKDPEKGVAVPPTRTKPGAPKTSPPSPEVAYEEELPVGVASRVFMSR